MLARDLVVHFHFYVFFFWLDGSPDSSWRQRLFRRTSSALLRWKYRTAEETALNVYLTYVTLPWHRIIGGRYKSLRLVFFFQTLLSFSTL